MGDPAKIIERFFGNRGAELLVDGVRISLLAETYGTPFFVHSRSVMAAKLRGLREALPEFDVYYSVKANPNQQILKFFTSQGLGLEVASSGELHQALAAGCPSHRILFAGPGKTPSEIEHALGAGIGEIHVESLSEIDTVSSIARRLNAPAPLAVRVNPAEAARGGAMQMGGRPSPFGLDEEQLEVALDRVLRDEALTFNGIHLFSGTQILDHDVLARQYEKALQLAAKAAAIAGKPLKTLDFGGGLGIPYFSGEAELDVQAFGRQVRSLVARGRSTPELRSTRFVIEPGRYLVGESGIYVCRVIVVKQSRGKTYVVVDGGMHHHLAASGNLGQVIKRNFPSALLNKLNGSQSGVVDVVGPLCTPLDVLARDTGLPEAEIGDLFGVFQSGAYARAASPMGFLSHPEPPEVWVHRGRHRLIRRRSALGRSLEDQRST